VLYIHSSFSGSAYAFAPGPRQKVMMGGGDDVVKQQMITTSNLISLLLLWQRVCFAPGPREEADCALIVRIQGVFRRRQLLRESRRTDEQNAVFGKKLSIDREIWWL
jgi:hypothetical protein